MLNRKGLMQFSQEARSNTVWRFLISTTERGKNLMAGKAKIERNKQRLEVVAKHAKRRGELKAIVRSPRSSQAEREAAQRELQALPRDASPTRVRNRCQVTGRPRAYIGKFGLSRIAFREKALEGEIPGVRNASW
jgi:small subunit ribosomal protein S14